MQIKNMRLFRQLYKKQLKNNEYNENYVGAYSNEHNEYGYFSLIHGGAKRGEFDHDFGNFLQAFLEMASDGQAVYEFLQNAVDVQSSQFFIRWGQLPDQDDNYVLIMNNGRPFSEKDIKSILNIGMSTKAYVNKGEEHTIGKFGIGFKLAHRLVGESNGLNELVNDYQGPILFSWHNDEWKTLAGDEPLTLMPLGDPTGDNSPWFFKILMTCFPCLPSEVVFDVKMNQGELFTTREVQVLRTYLRQYRDDIGNDFRQGSMFFIRLGRDKQKMLLADNLDTGVRFSTAILNQVAQSQTIMERVVMNQHAVEPPKLEYWSLHIDKEGDDRADFNYILCGNADHSGADTSRHQSIQLLMGYTNHLQAREIFRDVPNLYLFFPLSEEKHAFDFIIHSNAFYMASSRTKLHDGTNEGGINHRLFEVFIRRLSQDLQTWFATEDPEQQQQLLTIYPNLLLADPVQNTERAWVNNAFIVPLQRYLASHTPVRRSNVLDNVSDGGTSANVKILSTHLPLIDTRFLPTNVQWFYWSPTFANGDERLCDRAIVQLGLSRWTVMSLLEQPNIDVTALGRWLAEDHTRITTFLSELDFLMQGPYRQLDKAVEGKLATIKLFAFQQSEESHYFSLNDLNDENIWQNRLLRFANMTPLEPFLMDDSVGFVLSDLTLADYPNIYTYLKTRQVLVRYLGDFTLLNRIISSRLKNNTFLPEAKEKLLKGIEHLTDVTGAERDRRIEFIELYKNQLPESKPLPFKQLISPKLNVPNWLKSYEVNVDEYNAYPEMERYTTRSNPAVYESIILPNWELITQSTPNDVTAIYQDITKYYQAAGHPTTLTNRAYLISDGQWITLTANVHVHEKLQSVDARQYILLRQALQAVFGLCVPDKECLTYLENDPFKTNNQPLRLPSATLQTALSVAEVSALLAYCQLIDFPFFKHFAINPTADDAQFQITSFSLAGNQYYHNSKLVRQFVDEIMPEQYRPLPSAFASYNQMVPLRDDDFLRQIIREVDATDEPLMTKLCTIVGKAANAETCKALLDKIGSITLILSHGYDRDDLAVQVLNLWGASKDVHTAARRHILVQDGLRKETLDTVTLRGANQLHIGGYELPISDILTGSQNQQYAEWVSQLLAQFEILVDQSEALRNLLNLDQTPDADQVYTELAATLSTKNYILHKAAQIGFVVLYKQAKPSTDVSKWLVYDATGNLRRLEGVWYVAETPCSFIIPDRKLGSRYAGLAKLLKINQQQCEQKAIGISMRFEPLLESNATLNLMPAVRKALNNDLQLDLLTWYYDRWRCLEKPLECRPQNTMLATLLGFDPQAIVLNAQFACQAADSKEQLPFHVADWLDNLVTTDIPTRLEFMRMLGAHQDTSPVVTARKFMAGLTEHSPHQSLNPYQAYFTLRWLEEQEVAIPTEDNARKNLLRSYYSQSAQFAACDIPLPQFDPDTSTWQLGRFEHKPALLLTEAARQTLNAHPSAIAALARHFGGRIIQDNLLYTSHKQQLHNIVESSWYVTSINALVAPVLLEEAKEYDRLYYKRWRDKHDYQIYQVNDGIPLQMEVFDDPFFVYRDIDRSVMSADGKTLYVPAIWNDEIIIETAEKKWGDAGGALRQEFQQLDQYMLNLFRNPGANDIIGEEIRRLQEKIGQQQKLDEAKQIVNNIEHRYTLTWFRALIELEQKLSNGVNLMDNREGCIDFTAVENIPFEQEQEQILLRLSHASRTFSQNIESYGNFVAKLDVTQNGRRQSKNLHVLGVSKKGQTLLALVKQQDFQEFDGATIHRFSLSFVQQINFLATLDDNYAKMGLNEDYNFKDTLTSNIQFVFGPPGTGKTTHLSRFILERMRKEPKGKILVLAPTNKAADVLAARILKEETAIDNPAVWLARFGTTADQNLIEEGYLYDNNSWSYRPNVGTVLITTIHRFLYEQVSWGDGRVLLNEIPWHTIVVDEASMIALSYLNFVLHKRKYIGESDTLTEFIIGGDPFQLPPVVDIPNETDIDGSIKEENIYTMVGLRTFDPVEQANIDRYGDRITNLSTQYRSIYNIGELFSQFQYEGRLTHNRLHEAPRPLPAEWSSLSIQPVTCLRFPCNSDDTIYQPQRLRQSPYQLYSAQLLVETLRWMSQRLPETEADWTVGVVTPYRAQAQLVNKLLETVAMPRNFIVVADTVHGFQGDECDMVFVLLNPPNYRINTHPAAFINKNHLINVAISRAKDYLVLMYPDEQTIGIQNLKLIHNSQPNSIESIIQRLPLRLTDITLHTEQIERILFDSATYLQEHTFTQSHQMVNVYGRPIRHFTVKSDGNALDVQVKM